MNDDNDREKEFLKRELERVERERESANKGNSWAVVFLIWVLPLAGMLMMQGDDGPKGSGITPFGIWFIGFPLVVLIFRKLSQ